MSLSHTIDNEREGEIMRCNCPRVICTGKPEPNMWQMGERSGVSYKVEVSDGSGNVSMPCKDEVVYNAFVPFQTFSIDVEINQVANESRLGTRARIVSVAPVK